MPLFNVQPSIGFHPGDRLTEPMLDGDGNPLPGAGVGDYDPTKWSRNISLAGMNGEGVYRDVPGAPAEAEIRGRLEALAEHFPADTLANYFREAWIGQDADGNYTDIVRDVTVFRA